MENETSAHTPAQVPELPTNRPSPTATDATESPQQVSPQTPYNPFESLQTPRGFYTPSFVHNAESSFGLPKKLPVPCADDELDEATRRLKDLRTGTSPVFQDTTKSRPDIGSKNVLPKPRDWIHTPSLSWRYPPNQDISSAELPSTRGRQLPATQSSMWLNTQVTSSPISRHGSENMGIQNSGLKSHSGWDFVNFRRDDQAPLTPSISEHHLPTMSNISSSTGLQFNVANQWPYPWLNDVSKPVARGEPIDSDGNTGRQQISTALPNVAAARGFLPMQAVTYPQRSLLPLSYSGAANTELSFPVGKFSSRYHGMHTENNASADHIPPELNCALWLTNLPPDVSIHELLQVIRHVGRIWCSYINKPDHVNHQTAAAKVVFFTPDAAQRLLSISWTQGLVIRGYRIKAGHNRIKYESRQQVGRASRVLIITGDSKFVNEATLTKYFEARFVFQIDEVLQLISNKTRAVVEYRFGSYRCQAQMGKMSLEKDRPVGFEKVEFGEDPCETGIEDAAYHIAADRIRGLGL